MNYVWLTIALVTWCALHSVLIAAPVTVWLRRCLGVRYRYYRLLFNCVAGVTLVPVLMFARTLRGEIVFRWEGSLLVVQLLLLAAALLLFAAGGRHYDLQQFLGWRQIRSDATAGALTDTGHLDTTGVLGLTRHPWYLGAILMLWSFWRTTHVSTLIVNVVFTIYLIVGTLLEERKLVCEYGEEYRHYQRQVSMLVPVKNLVAGLRALFDHQKEG